MKVDDFKPVQTNSFSTSVKLKAKIWSLVNKTIYRYSPYFSRKFRILLVRIFGARVDWSCSLNRLSVIDYPWNLKMDKFSSLGENTWAYCLEKITIGEKCCIGKDVYLLSGSHDILSPNFYLVTKPIIIKNCVWVSTGSYILPGVTLENFSVVGAASIVTKNVQEKSIVAGNPAKFIKERLIKNE